MGIISTSMISFNILQDSKTRQYYAYLLRGIRDYGLQPHFENSDLPGAFGVWHSELEGPRIRRCAEIMPMGRPPSSGKTRWQDWPRYGNSIHGYFWAGLTTMVPGVSLSCLSFPRLNCHNLVCVLSHTCSASIPGPVLSFFFLLLQFSPRWSGAAGDLVIHM